MTKLISIISALLTVPALYLQARSQVMQPDSIMGFSGCDLTCALTKDVWGDALVIVLSFLGFFVAGHIIWLLCRAFNKVMRVLE